MPPDLPRRPPLRGGRHDQLRKRQRAPVPSAREGTLAPSAHPGLRHGAVGWELDGGAGAFEGASGRIVSNFLLSNRRPTDHQLGVLFRRATRERTHEATSELHPPPAGPGRRVRHGSPAPGGPRGRQGRPGGRRGPRRAPMRRLRRRRSPRRRQGGRRDGRLSRRRARDRRRGRADEPGDPRTTAGFSRAGRSTPRERRRTRRSGAPPGAGRRPSSTREARPARTGCSRCAPPPPMRRSCTGGSRSRTGQAAGLRAVRTGPARWGASRPDGRDHPGLRVDPAERAARRVRGDRDDERCRRRRRLVRLRPELRRRTSVPGVRALLGHVGRDDRGQVLLGRSGPVGDTTVACPGGTRAVGELVGHRDAAVRVDLIRPSA